MYANVVALMFDTREHLNEQLLPQPLTHFSTHICIYTSHISSHTCGIVPSGGHNMELQAQIKGLQFVLEAQKRAIEQKRLAALAK